MHAKKYIHRATSYTKKMPLVKNCTHKAEKTHVSNIIDIILCTNYNRPWQR